MHRFAVPLCLIALVLGCASAHGVSTAPKTQAGTLSPLLDQLNKQALAANQEYRQCASALAKASTPKQRRKDRTEDMLNYATLFKGVSPSTEASRALVHEQLPTKSLAATTYKLQKLADETELQVTTQVVQLAMGIGNRDRTQGKQQIQTASLKLNKLAGSGAAPRAVAVLAALQSSNPMPRTGPASIEAIENESQQALHTTLARDRTIAKIRQEVSHYNGHSKKALAGQRVARTTLSAASLMPSLVGPAAQVVLFGEIAGTGGTEQNKLLQELYIDKRVNSRVSVLQEMVHMAVYNQHVAALTNNATLRACSAALLARLSGSPSISSQR